MAVLRLYTVALVNLVSIPAFLRARQLPSQQQQATSGWLAYWMVAVAESLCVTALGYPVRLQLHLPLQLAALGLATCNLPRICSQLYPTVAAGACLGSSVSVAAVCGYLLPSVAMHCMERSSRATFAAGLVAHAAAAAAQHAD